MGKGKKNTAQRELSACVEERFNGFGLVKKLVENLIRQNYKPMNIVYRRLSKISKIINFYFTTSMRNAYRVVFERNNENISATADQCFSYNKLFIERKSLESHMNVCGHLPGIIYKFENQNIQTFLNNMKFMRDIPQ